MLLVLIGISHMVLDSVVGDIGWLKPWHDGLNAMFAMGKFNFTMVIKFYHPLVVCNEAVTVGIKHLAVAAH